MPHSKGLIDLLISQQLDRIIPHLSSGFYLLKRHSKIVSSWIIIKISVAAAMWSRWVWVFQFALLSLHWYTVASSKAFVPAKCQLRTWASMEKQVILWSLQTGDGITSSFTLKFDLKRKAVFNRTLPFFCPKPLPLPFTPATCTYNL